jgi:hypothetical protein
MSENDLEWLDPEWVKIRKSGPKIRFNDKVHVQQREAHKRKYWREKIAKLAEEDKKKPTIEVL